MSDASFGDAFREPAFTDPWEAQRAAMGALIRHQREMANMSLRQLSQATKVSNAYLSQIERGMHDPTLRVLVQIGNALQLSVDDLLQKGLDGEDAEESTPGVEAAILLDRRLTPAEKEALLAVYRSYLRAHHDTPSARKPRAKATRAKASSTPPTGQDH